MKFYCPQTKKRFKYSEMPIICVACNFTGQCNAYAIAYRRGLFNNPAALVRLFCRWLEKE